MSYPSDLTGEQWDLLEPVFNASSRVTTDAASVSTCVEMDAARPARQIRAICPGEW